MRLVHTSDWHLGRTLFGQPLIDDQFHVLKNLVAIVKEERVDALIIAGDVFDRVQPPRDALSLFDEILTEIVADLNIPAIVIAGNHDGAELIELGSRITAKSNFFRSGHIRSSFKPVTLEDQWGPVHFYPIPYAEPAIIHERLKADTESDVNHDSAMAAIVDTISKDRPEGERTVAVAHAFVEDCSTTDSERLLTVGGAGTILASRFDGFDYVALGHLHRPQDAGKKTIRYSGSLLKYSVSEVDHKKSVSLVELDSKGKISVGEIELSPKRDLRVIQGHFEELLTGPLQGPRDDYLQISLLDREPIMDSMSRLRAVYPNLLNVKRIQQTHQTGAPLDVSDHREISTIEKFKSFFYDTTGGPVDEGQLEVVKRVIDVVQQEEA